MSFRCTRRAGIAIALAGALALAGAFWTACPSQGTRVMTGVFDSFDEGARASISEVSRYIKRCPSVARVRVHWRHQDVLSVNGVRRSYEAFRATVYDRSETGGTIGYEADVHSGPAHGWATTDQELHAVAAMNGQFDDFGERHF